MYPKSRKSPETAVKTYVEEKLKKTYLEEELTAYSCRMKADVLLFEAYPYLSVKGLTEEYWRMVEEKNESI